MPTVPLDGKYLTIQQFLSPCFAQTALIAHCLEGLPASRSDDSRTLWAPRPCIPGYYVMVPASVLHCL